MLITAAVIGLFYIAGNIVWLRQSSPIKSVSVLPEEIFFFKQLGGFEKTGKLGLRAIFSDVRSFYYVLPVWLLRHGLTDYRYPVFFNLIYVFTALFFLSRIAEKRYGSSTAAIIVIFFALYPGTYIYSRYLIKEYSLIALNTAAFYLLLKSEDFHRTGLSILAGIAFGTGIMFRETLVIYMSGVLLLAFMSVLRNIISSKKPWKRIMNMALYFLLAGWIVRYRIASPETAALFLGKVKVHSAGAGFYSGVWFRNLYYFLLSPVFFISASASAGIMAFSRKTREDYYILSWCLFPLAIYAFFLKSSGDLMYTLPAIPSAALISGAAVQKLLLFKKGKIILLLMILFGAAQYCLMFSSSRKENRLSDYTSKGFIPGFISNYEVPNSHIRYPLLKAAKHNIMAEVYRILKENRQKKVIFLHSHHEVPDSYWIFPLEVLINTEQSFSGLDYRFITLHDPRPLLHKGDIFDRADLLFYNGPLDIKEPSCQQEYVESLLNRQIDHALKHPHIFSPEEYEEIARGNVRLIFGGKSREEIIADFAAEFTGYELMEKTGRYYAENRLYVYRKTSGERKKSRR